MAALLMRFYQLLLFSFVVSSTSFAQTSEEWYTKGRSEASNEEKIHHFDQALIANPRHAYAYFYRGIAKSELGLHQEALADFNLASEYDPDMIVLEPSFLDHVNNQNLKLIELTTQRIKENPQDPMPYFERGMANYRLTRHKMALKDFSKVIKLNPDHHESYYYRGLLNSLSGKKEKALTDYTYAIQLAPDEGMYFFRRGRLRHQLRAFDESTKDFDRAEQHGIAEPIIFYERGYNHYLLKNFQEALTDFEKYLQYKPDDSEILEMKANTEAQLKRTKK
ncbi:MAG: tetratricopeptide repeat protein [Bacteroidota bacterium]